jgi:hypothetical protein
VHRDDRIANRVAGAPVPQLERVRAAAQDGRGFGVAELVPQDELERFAVSRPQRVNGGADLRGEGVGVAPSEPVVTASWDRRACRWSRRRSERRWFATMLRATPNSHRRSPGGAGTWSKRRHATVKTWAITSSASCAATRRKTYPAIAW